MTHIDGSHLRAIYSWFRNDDKGKGLTEFEVETGSLHNWQVLSVGGEDITQPTTEVNEDAKVYKSISSHKSKQSAQSSQQISNDGKQRKIKF